MKNPIDAIIFDLDGTLIDSITDIALCANEVLMGFGFPSHPIPLYKELVGDGLANLARKVLPQDNNSPEVVDRFIANYRSIYAKKWNATSSVYDGVNETLAALVQRDIPLAVLSNKRDDFTKLCISHFFPSIPFRVVCGERKGVPIKPDPHAAVLIAKELSADPTRSLFVGDSEIDIETGNRAGMQSVGVLWGFRPRSVLEAASPSHLISMPHQLIEVLGFR